MDLNDFIHLEKLSPILRNFIDILKINIFIVDLQGKAVLTPKTDSYGWKLISRYDQGAVDGKFNILDKFVKSGEGHLEYKDAFGLNSFAVPVGVEAGKPLSYIIVGPVILNKRLKNPEYEEIARGLNSHVPEILDELEQVRVLSYASLRSILDLLFEFSKYAVGLNIERKTLEMQSMEKNFPKEIKSMAEHIYSSIHMDELLVVILDMAMALTQAECGSIMTIDERTNEFMIEVSRGIDERWVARTHMKKEEGLAGFVMKEKKTLVIDSSCPNNRIEHFLKRPDIKYSIVMPLVVGKYDDVVGVLNLSSRQPSSALVEHNEELINNLFKLTSAAIKGLASIQSFF